MIRPLAALLLGLTALASSGCVIATPRPRTVVYEERCAPVVVHERYYRPAPVVVVERRPVVVERRSPVVVVRPAPRTVVVTPGPRRPQYHR